MGPLAGKTIIEFAGLGPAPYAGMMLADMGADVIRIERPGGGVMTAGADPRLDFHNRGKSSICINLKSAVGIACVERLLASADAMIEGFRPGVMEKLGLGPERCLEINPQLVYGRMTGWGQDGPLAAAAGHDINYIALTGALHAIGPRGQKPSIPLNLVGDYGGGGMMLAFGLVCALLEAQNSGHGQVIDSSIVDGTASLMGFAYSALQAGSAVDKRGENILDSGAFFYNVYETSDGGYISVGSIEPQFFNQLVELLELDAATARGDTPINWRQLQWQSKHWADLSDKFAALFKTKTRDHWCQLLEGTDVCFAPVLSMQEARHHPHNISRGTFIDDGETWQPAPTPRFSRTQAEVKYPAVALGENTRAVLAVAGYGEQEIEQLISTGAVAC
jgi:alpha-methylacyl-CoA racemase